MIFRLITDFFKDRSAAISVLTAGLMPLFFIFIVTAYDFGRYYMLTRVLATATQQTADWVKARDANGSYDFNSNAAKLYFDNLMQRQNLTSTNVELLTDDQRNQFWIVAKANYDLTVSKLLPVPPLPLYAKAFFWRTIPPLFVTIVFSSGEMQSEGIHAYGAGYDNIDSATKGVSWSNPYYTDAIGKNIQSRTTPTHNYYMVAALVKELTKKYVGTRSLYINIIPASATINLNPGDYNANPQGSKEGTLPNWIYNDQGFDISNTSSAPKNSAICITNRGLPYTDPDPYNIYKSQYSWTYNYFNLIPVFTHDYYKIFPSELSTNIGLKANNWFTDEELLMDSSFNHVLEAGDPYNMTTAWASQKRGYPFDFLTSSSKACPAINSTPALATFQNVTSATYSEDSRNLANVSENQIFWDYMRNYIDPAMASSFNIWGSPNLAFGLQIAYENIGYVQSSMTINNNGGTYNPRSEFQVFVVSDQIGGVKNAGAAPYIPTVFAQSTSSVYIQSYNRCWGSYSGKGVPEYSQTLCTNIWLSDSYNKAYLGYPTVKDTSSSQSGPFFFTHMWWDSTLNPVSNSCYANSMIGTQSCDTVYSATPLMVMKHFYNITNYALDLRYNKTGSSPMKRPKVYFIDTGSGKISNDCNNSNRVSLPHTIFGLYNVYTGQPQLIDSYSRTWLKPCNAYAAMTGYATGYNLSWVSAVSSTSAVRDPSVDYEGGIISMASDDATAKSIDGYPQGLYSRAQLEQYAPADISVSGFDRVYAFRYTVPNPPYLNANVNTADNRGVDAFASKYLPIVYYDSGWKMQLQSRPINSNWSNSWDGYATVNNTDNAAKIAAFVVADTAWSSLITRPIIAPK